MGGGILLPHTLSVSNSDQAYSEDLWMCMVGANRFQQCLGRTGSGSSTEDRACLKDHSENSGLSALGDTEWSDTAREIRIKFYIPGFPSGKYSSARRVNGASVL
jgi:hypothetical protein